MSYALDVCFEKKKIYKYKFSYGMIQRFQKANYAITKL